MIKFLDQFDLYLLSAIRVGIGSNSFLAMASGKSKPAITQRVDKLYNEGLIEYIETNQKHYYLEYSLTPKADRIVQKLVKGLNISKLQIEKEEI